MKVNAQKLEFAMANACMNPYDLCREANMKYQAYHRITRGANSKPATIGRIAKALNVSVQDIVETDAATSEGDSNRRDSGTH